MKKQDIIFWILKVLLDFVIVLVSFFLARELRLLWNIIPGLNLQIQTIDSYNLFIYVYIYLMTWWTVVPIKSREKNKTQHFNHNKIKIKKKL